MAVQFDERWLGLWVCDDARAVRLQRAGDALSVTVTDARGALLDELSARFEAPDPTRAARPDSQPSDRMGKVYAEVGHGANAQTYTLHFAVLDRAPDARFKYREARPEDPIESVVIEPASGASWIEINSSDPWSDPDYGMISWAAPLLPYTYAGTRADPHPRCDRRSSYWKLSSSESDPGSLSGREADEREARGWCDPRCVRCGSAGAAVVRASDDSGTAWRQLFIVLRCDRCGRWSQWWYDD